MFPLVFRVCSCRLEGVVLSVCERSAVFFVYFMEFPIFRVSTRASRLFLCVWCSYIIVALRKIDRFLFGSYIGLYLEVPIFRVGERASVFLVSLHGASFPRYGFSYVCFKFACVFARLFCVRPASTKTSPTAWKRESLPKKMCTPPRSKPAPTSSFLASQVRDVSAISY